MVAIEKPPTQKSSQRKRYVAETEEGEKVGELRYLLCGESGDPVKVERMREPRNQVPGHHR